MRTSATLIATLVLAACGSDSRTPSAERSAGQASRGPDAVLLRVPRAGGRASAVVYPNVDSTVWRSTTSVPPLSRVLSFDADGGVVAAVDTGGIPTRIDLRLGTAQRVSKTPLTALASTDGVAIFGISPTGEVTRLTPSGGNWTVRLASSVQALAPQRDGVLLVAGARGADAVVWRLRPPTTRVSDSAVIENAGRVVSALGADRIYFASGRDLSGVQTRNLEPLPTVRFSAPIHAIVATPSGDRFYASLDDSEELSVLDRYSNAVASTVMLPGVASDLRMDPLGRYVLVRAAQGDSAWVVAVGTDRVVGMVPTAWRTDLPLVLPDGAILTVLGADVVVRDGAGLTATRTIAGGASDLWHLLMWNGFRPRAAGLDKPVQFETDAPRGDSTADSATVDSAGHPDSVRTPPPDTATTRRPGVAEAEAAVPAARGYTVQFAAAVTEHDARVTLKKLRLDAGLTPRIVPTVRNGKTLYRVVVGPFATRAQADRVGRGSGHDYWLYEGAP